MVTWQKELIDEKIRKLKKYIDGTCDIRVVLGVEKFRQVVEINFLTDGLNINSREEAKEMSQAIDIAIEKVERQLKKHREKIREFKTTELADLKTNAETSPEAAKTTGRIIEEEKYILKPMSLEDALVEMETESRRFVIYRDPKGKIYVLYLRDDGNYGLLETNG
jgi:putative sigma-54 modulation protein